jgi:hypothetical protein
MIHGYAAYNWTSALLATPQLTPPEITSIAGPLLCWKKKKQLFTRHSFHRKEDCCSAASKNAKSRQPASRYAECSTWCPAGELGLKQNGPFQGSSFRRPVARGSSPPLLLAEASPLQKGFLLCSSGTLSCAILKMINICYSARGCRCEHQHPTQESNCILEFLALFHYKAFVSGCGNTMNYPPPPPHKK